MITNRLFRAAALAKMQSPERMDAPTTLTRPAGWLAVLGTGVALATVGWWAFFGTILQTATGSGIIVRDADVGIMVIAGEGTGKVGEVLVSPGQIVHAGDPVVRLDVSAITQTLDANESQLEILLAQDKRQNEDDAARLRLFQEKLTNQEKLVAKGLLTQNTLLETRNRIYEIRAQAEDRRQRILEQQQRGSELRLRLAREAEVRTFHKGRVTEILVDKGDYVLPGKPIIRLESIEGDYEALCYVSADKGKKIQPGTSIRVSPSTVRAEEYGYILGRVAEVSSHPVTREKVLSELGNARLVDGLFDQGAVIEVLAELERDPGAPSGYRWSSSRGPDLSVEGGTLCSASIVLERDRPIRLLIPFLRKQLGLH
ncbi:MAG: NHLP bacteriocin system secretion protein [Terrimicrobiaceae bacterium]|nr:NHLP bacteriocin system secretion protein [Terrimicrobiaceae bacterium]